MLTYCKKDPLYLPDRSTLTVSMYRKTDGRKVWYDWMTETWMDLPAPPGIQVEDFESQRIRLGVTEVMSSKERGCMM